MSDAADDHADALCGKMEKEWGQWFERLCSYLAHADRSAHRYEENTPQQGPSERCLDDFLVTLGASTVSLQQRRDVKRHLCDGAKGRVDDRPHRKVTLGRNAVKREIKDILGHCRSSAGYTIKHSSPGDAHADIVGYRNDGGDGCGKLGVCATVLVVPVGIANNQSDDDQGEQICGERRCKESNAVSHIACFHLFTTVSIVRRELKILSLSIKVRN